MRHQFEARLARIEKAERGSKSFIVVGCEDEAAAVRAKGLAEDVTIIITGVPRERQADHRPPCRYSGRGTI